MKRRSLTLVLCLLATLSLASVGFAAWVISAGDVEYAQGNIQVETVNDERVFIDDESVKLNGAATANFIFGKPEDATDTAGTWLESAEVDVQVLEVTVTFTVTNKKAAPATLENTSLTATLSAFTMQGEDEIAVNLQNAVNAGYIDAIPTATVEATGNDNEFQAVFTFTWGDLFENKNPFVFYNTGHKATDTLKVVEDTGIPSNDGTKVMTYGDHAAKYIYEMADFFDGVKFKITLTADQKNA